MKENCYSRNTSSADLVSSGLSEELSVLLELRLLLHFARLFWNQVFTYIKYKSIIQSL